MKREKLPAMETHTKATLEEIRALAGLLKRMGAHESEITATALANPIPFHLLDTPDVRSLLAGLTSLLLVPSATWTRKVFACRRSKAIRWRLIGPREAVTKGRE